MPETSPQVIYFYVPYSEKSYAKSMGCIWDIRRKLWYINSDHINKKTMCFSYRVCI